MVKKLILVIATTLGLSSCGFSLASDCADTIKSEAKSPDGKYIVTLYERDCGATTDFSTIVNIRASSAKFNGEEGRVLIVKGQPEVLLAWKDNTRLQLECHDCRANDIFKQEKSWKDVIVSY